MKTTFSKIANKQPNKLQLITKSSTVENSLTTTTTSENNSINNNNNNNRYNHSPLHHATATTTTTNGTCSNNNNNNNNNYLYQPAQQQQHWYSDSHINNIIENDGYYSTERSSNSYRDADVDDDEEYDVEVDDEEDDEDDDVDLDGIDTDELLFSDYHAGTSQSMDQQQQQQQMPSVSNNNNDYDSLMVSSINPKVRSNTQEQQPHYYQLALNMSVASTNTDQSSAADCYYRYNDDSINNWSMRLSQMTNGGGGAYFQATARNFQHHHHNHHHHKQHRSLSQSQCCHSPSPPSTTTSNSQTTTSWGKLKHSKSMNQQQLVQQQHSQSHSHSQQHQPRRATKKRMLRTQTEPCSIQQTQSPSLFQLYSRTKLSKSPTVTFGELKNRKQFNTTENESSTSQSIIDAFHYSSSKQTATTTVKTENQKMPMSKTNKKISIGTQYPPYLMDQSIQTSTIHTLTPSQTRYHKVNAALQTDLLRPPPALPQTQPQLAKKPVPVSQAKLKQTMKKLFFKSLPDLTFLNTYSDTKPTQRPSTDQPQQQPNDTNTDQSNNLLLLNSCSSSFDNNKRKTLKSIKRYRQTKQVTEPLQIPSPPPPIINQPPPPPPPTTTTQQTQTSTKIRSSESFNVKTTATASQQTKPNSTNSSSSSSSSGYISSKAQITSAPPVVTTTQTTATSPIPTIQTPPPTNNQQSQSKSQQGPPLKSCLKRKDSASFSSTSNSSELTSHPTSIIFKRNSNQQQNSTQMLPVHLKYLFLNNSELKFDLKAMSIHIPSVGWLFTCDGKSLKRYSYYKKLCKYKINNEQVLHEVDEKEGSSGGGGGGGTTTTTTTTNGDAVALAYDDEDDDNDEDIDGDDEEEEDEDECDNVNKQTSFDETKLRVHQHYGSDNDIKQTQQQTHQQQTQQQQTHHHHHHHPAQRCVSFSERILHHTFVPSQQSSPIHQQHQHSRRLQYDTLIEMLKKANNLPLNQTKIKRSLSNRCPPTTTTTTTTTTATTTAATVASTRITANRAIVTQLSSEKAQQITASTQQNVFIDADSISLASLSESPPNEFKFSDYEEEDEEENGAGNQQTATAAGIDDESDADKLVPPIKATIKQTPNDANVIDLCSNVQSNQKQIKEKLARLQQQQQTQQTQQQTIKINPLINDFKIILFQLKEIYLKEQVLNNEKNQFIDKLLRENVCKIVYDLLKDNLKIICNEPIIKTSINSQLKLDELRLEQLCKLFQYAIKNMLLSSTSANNKQTIDDLFVFNEASSLQKYEAFIYFLLNTKQLANLIEYMNNDRQLIEKYYDLVSPSSSINNNSSSVSCQTTSQMFLFTNKYNFDELMKQLKQLNQLKFDLKYYFYKTKSFQKSPAPPPPPLLLPTTTSILPPPPTSSTLQSNIQPVPPPPPRVVLSKPLNAQQQTTNFQYTGNTHTSTNSNIIKSQKQPTPPPPPLQSSTQSSSPSQSSNVGFNFKSISKKFNIKSWFTNSKHHQHQHQQQLQQQQQQQPKSTADLMKHSFSEPLINDFTTNIDYNNQKSQTNHKK